MNEVDDFIDRHGPDIKASVDVAMWRKELGELEARGHIINPPLERNRQFAARLHTNIENAKKKKLLADLIERSFMSKFGLQRHKTVENFIAKCFGAGMWPFEKHVLDHCTYYRKLLSAGYAFIVVSQPYDYDHEHVEKVTAELEIGYHDLEEWGWYYPGRTSCFALTFTKPVVQRFRKERLDYRRVNGHFRSVW